MQNSARLSVRASSDRDGKSAPSLWRGSLVACVSVVAAWAGTHVIERLLPGSPLTIVLFFVAVLLCVGLAGLWSGLLATFLSALVCDYFFLSPIHSFEVEATDIPRFTLFLVAAGFVTAIVGVLHARTHLADQRYLQLVQTLDAIVWELNPRTRRFSFVNSGAENLLGYPVRQWLTEPDIRSRYVHPDDAERVRGFWSMALASNGEHATEYRATAANGAELWLRETLSVTLDAAGRPSRVTGLAIDVTARKHEADELRRIKDEVLALNQITTALSASLELDDFYAVLQTELRQHFGVEQGLLHLTNGASDELRPVMAWGGLATQEERDRIPDDGAVDTSPIPVVRSESESGRGAEGDATAIDVPLAAKEELCGMLTLFWPSDCLHARPDEVFLATLGRQLGTLVQNASLYREVREGRERLQQLSRQLVTVQEAERRAIARELHDEIGQLLTGLKLTLESRSDPLASSERPDMAAVEITRELMERVDGLSLDLRPAMLDDLGLLSALSWHCRRFSSLTGIEVQLVHSGADARMPAEVEITAYRVIQESLTNVARHSGAASAAVRLWRTPDTLRVQVEDTGQGFNASKPADDAQAIGLTGMQERVGLLNGSLTIETAAGVGTLITADFPLKSGAQEQSPVVTSRDSAG